MKRLLTCATLACAAWFLSLTFGHAPDPNDPLQAAMPVLKVADVARSIDYYTKVLGFHEEFRAGDPPNYAGVGRGMVTFHLSTGADAIEKGSVYVLVKEVDKLHEEFKGKGAQIIEPLADWPYQMREFSVKTSDGHVLHFGQAIEKKKD